MTYEENVKKYRDMGWIQLPHFDETLPEASFFILNKESLYNEREDSYRGKPCKTYATKVGEVVFLLSDRFIEIKSGGDLIERDISIRGKLEDFVNTYQFNEKVSKLLNE